MKTVKIDEHGRITSKLHTCEGCDAQVADGYQIEADGEVLCRPCVEDRIRETMDFHTWKEWVKICKEDETPEQATTKEYLKWHEEAWEENKGSKHYKIMKEMLTRELKKAA